MKLVNKKTGQVKTFRFPHYEWGDDDKQYTINMFDYEGNEYNYSTLAELNEEWEDYTPDVYQKYYLINELTGYIATFDTKFEMLMFKREFDEWREVKVV